VSREAEDEKTEMRFPSGPDAKNVENLSEKQQKERRSAWGIKEKKLRKMLSGGVTKAIKHFRTQRYRKALRG